MSPSLRGRAGWPGRPAALALLLASLAGRAGASGPRLAEPLPWRDPATLALPFLQLPFESPATLQAGRWQLRLETLYAAEIFRARSPDLQVDVEVEVALPTLVLRRGLGHGLELQVAVPGAIQGPGFLDGSIRAVEAVFHSVNERRLGPDAVPGRLWITRPDGRGVRWQGSRGGLGDAWAGVKWGLASQRGPLPALATRLALKLPTGRFPLGSEGVEAGAGLLAGWRLGPATLLAQADLMVPTGRLSALDLPTRPHASVQLGLGQPLTTRLTAWLQGSGHGAGIARVHLGDVDGWAFYVVGGLRYAPTLGTSVGLGLAENLVHTEHGADFTALMDLAWRP